MNARASLRPHEVSWILEAKIRGENFCRLSDKQRKEFADLESYLKMRSNSDSSVNVPEILHRFIAFCRLLNQGIQARVAYKTVFGPDIVDERECPEDLTLCFDGGFEGVTFFAVLPRALEILDPTQKGTRLHADFRIPEDWLNWKWGRNNLSRISVQTWADIPVWIDHVRVYGGIPKIVALAATPEEESVVLAKTPILGIDILSAVDIRRIDILPRDDEGFPDFFERVRLTDPFIELRKINEVVSLSEYRNPLAEDLPSFVF